jgi:hypothetical protein
MPPFRIHQTRIRPERILVRLQQGKYVLASQLPLLNAPATESNVAIPKDTAQPKSKNVISLKQIKQIIGLLQQSNHKQLSKMLSPELTSLLSIQDEDVDKVEEEVVEEVEEENNIDDLELDEDEDLLIIDV